MGLAYSDENNNKDQAQKLMDEAIEAFKMGDSIAAIKHVKKVVELIPNNAQYWFRYGLFCFNMEQYDEALNCYDISLKINPNYDKVWYNKGLILSIRKRYKEAIECYDKTLQINPEKIDALYNKACNYRDLEDFNEALRLFDSVLEKDENHHSALLGKAFTFAKTGNEIEALVCYKRYTELNPDKANGWYERGVSEQALEKFTEAKDSYSRALKLNPKLGFAWANRAAIHYNEGDYKTALEYFKEALKYGIEKASQGVAACNERLEKVHYQLRKVEEFNIGDVIEQYFTVFDIKQGGMGTVYLCYDQTRSGPVALKTFHQKYLSIVNFRNRFINEGQIWMSLTKHPNILKCFGVFESLNGRPYLILEYIRGKDNIGSSLRNLMEKVKIEFYKKIDIAIQICNGMQHANNCVPGFIHCDLKPENILITDEYVVKVTDFGIAIVLKEKENHHSYGGTLLYMSPEQIISDNISVQSDIYAMGCILYELFTGIHPFPYSDENKIMACHLNSSPAPMMGNIPIELNYLVLKCLEKNKKDRPDSFESIKDQLMNIYKKYTGIIYNEKVIFESELGYELVNKAIALHRLGKSNQALDILSELIKQEKNSNYSFIYGNILLDCSRYNEALQAYNKFLETIDGNDIELKIATLSNKANCLDYLGRTEEALQIYDIALEFEPENYDVWLNKAVTLNRVGRYSEAEKLIDTYLKIEKYDCDFLGAKADILSKTNRLNEAISYYDLLLEINPVDKRALNEKGCVLFSLKIWEKACECFDRLISIDNSNARAWYNMGVCHTNMQSYEKAVFCFNKTLQINPEYPDVENEKQYALSKIHLRK